MIEVFEQNIIRFLIFYIYIYYYLLCKYNLCAKPITLLNLLMLHLIFSVSLVRFVYDDLVTNGIIVPEQEVPPPTVPMDYSWARVRHVLCFYDGNSLLKGSVLVAYHAETW